MLRVNFYPGFEKAFYECELCNEPVTNPICPECLVREIEIWASNYPNLKRELVPRLKKYLRKLREQPAEFIKCIQCKENEVPLCPYCFIREVLDELEFIDATRQTKKEFLKFFNFDVGHTEYKI
tara:strand:- start:708 stop:1079 length:372 start_codon:yes stop_codon:yes gene_type:complete